VFFHRGIFSATAFPFLSSGVLVCGACACYPIATLLSQLRPIYHPPAFIQTPIPHPRPSKKIYNPALSTILTPPLTETPKAEHRTSPRQPLLPLPHAGARTRPTLLRYTDGHLYGRAPRRPTKSPQPERGFWTFCEMHHTHHRRETGSIANFFSGLVYT